MGKPPSSYRWLILVETSENLFCTREETDFFSLQHFLIQNSQCIYAPISSIQFSCSVVFDSLQPHESQHTLSITNSQSLLKLMSIESVMPSSHLILYHPLLLLLPISPSITVFSSESTLHMRWPKYWSFSFSIIPSKEITGLIFLQSKGPSRVFSNTTVQTHQFFGAQLSSQSKSHIRT